jgi:UV excision repair protein RAD23
MVIRVATEEEVFEVCVWSYDTIGYMKEQVQHEREIPIGDQRYIFRGKLLQDSRTLSFYGVTAGDVLKLLPVWAPAPGTTTATATTSATGSSTSRAPANASATALATFAEQVFDCIHTLHTRVSRLEELVDQLQSQLQS